MPACKETNINRPLDVTSRHVPHVPRSWPVAWLGRLGSSASSVEGVLQAKATLIGRFKHLSAPRSLIPLPIDTSVGLGKAQRVDRAWGRDGRNEVQVAVPPILASSHATFV